MGSRPILKRLLHIPTSRISLLPPFNTAEHLSVWTQTPSNSNISDTALPFRLPSCSLNQQPTSAVLFSSFCLSRRLFNTHSNHEPSGSSQEYETSEEGETDGWEEEEENVEAKAGDGGDGGGVVLHGVSWGERALSIAREVLLQFGDGIDLYAFKTTPRGYIYVRLDKLSNEYGCPSMEELESYCQEYKKRLEEVGTLGEIPDDLALEVSSPGAERILRVPDDLCRFKAMPMRVSYVEGVDSNGPEKDAVFFLESIEKESETCVWKLADVKENRDPEAKGRPLNRKRRDWRLKLPFEMHRRVTLYLEF